MQIFECPLQAMRWALLVYRFSVICSFCNELHPVVVFLLSMGVTLLIQVGFLNICCDYKSCHLAKSFIFSFSLRHSHHFHLCFSLPISPILPRPNPPRQQDPSS